MEEIKRNGLDFTGYDYKELSAAGERAAFYLDCYQCFGWQPDERMGVGGSKGTLLLKRARKLINKMELTRLQRHFEACVDEIRALERSKTSAATAAALLVGLGGCVFLAASVFMVTHVPPLWIPSFILAAPGLAGWVVPVFLYRSMAARRAKIVAELVEKKYDEIYEICKQGSRLLC